jgi:hypothetical protein
MEEVSRHQGGCMLAWPHTPRGREESESLGGGSKEEHEK